MGSPVGVQVPLPAPHSIPGDDLLLRRRDFPGRRPGKITAEAGPTVRRLLPPPLQLLIYRTQLRGFLSQELEARFENCRVVNVHPGGFLQDLGGRL